MGSGQRLIRVIGSWAAWAAETVSVLDKPPRGDTLKGRTAKLHQSVTFPEYRAGVST